MRAFKVGGEVDSYCGRCKMLLNHKIVAMVGDVPKRVHCLTCHQEHNHRTPASRPSKPSVSSAAKPKASPRIHAWSLHMAAWDAERAIPYAVSQTFNIHDFILHTVFGRGVVTNVAGPDKIIALFESGEKMLMQGRVAKPS